MSSEVNSRTPGLSLDPNRNFHPARTLLLLNTHTHSFLADPNHKKKKKKTERCPIEIRLLTRAV